ncbi:hypothetical protein [Streptomyces sp. WAC06614]|nr:hypothetical protein [Streptomyces sp. WAC06614]
MCRVGAAAGGGDGDWVQGNDIWYRLHGKPGWVSARYVHNYTVVPWC